MTTPKTKLYVVFTKSDFPCKKMGKIWPYIIRKEKSFPRRETPAVSAGGAIFRGWPGGPARPAHVIYVSMSASPTGRAGPPSPAHAIYVSMSAGPTRPWYPHITGFGPAWAASSCTHGCPGRPGPSRETFRILNPAQPGPRGFKIGKTCPVRPVRLWETREIRESHGPGLCGPREYPRGSWEYPRLNEWIPRVRPRVSWCKRLGSGMKCHNVLQFYLPISQFGSINHFLRIFTHGSKNGEQSKSSPFLWRQEIEHLKE